MKNLNDLLYDSIQSSGETSKVRIGIATPQTIIPLASSNLQIDDLFFKSFVGGNKIRIYKP